MAKYFVTGGAGFIGSHLVDRLVAGGDKVVVFDNLSSGHKRNIQDHKKDDVRLVEGDVREHKEVLRAAKGCDFALHVAGIPSVAQSVRAPEDTLNTAFQGTLNVLSAAREHRMRRVVYASSCSVYGESPVLPKEESMLPTPYSPHGAAALCGEELMRVFYATYRLETVSLRLFNVYGPRQPWDTPDCAVIPRFCARLLQEEPAIIYGDGKQSRDFVHVSDVVEAFHLACTAPKAEGEAFNVAAGARLSIQGLLSLFGGILEREFVPKYEDARPADVRHSLAETQKAQEVLGFRPRIPVGEGVIKCLIWYRKALGKSVKLVRASGAANQPS